MARRRRILDSARRLFVRNGFGGTTVAAIASDADVSPETVYKAFGGKTGLVEAVYREGLHGEGPVAAYERSERLRTATDPFEMMRGWSSLAVEVGQRVSPIHLLVRDAAVVDPSMQGLLRKLDDDRHQRMAENAHHLQATGQLRAELDVTAATDVMWSVTSPEMYELLVLRQQWSLERLAGWIYHALTALLAADATGRVAAP